VLQLSDVALNRWICRMCTQSIASMDTNALCQLHQYILAHEVEGLVKREKLPELEGLLQHRGAMQRAWQMHERNLLSSRNRAQGPSSGVTSRVAEDAVEEDGGAGADHAWSEDGESVHGRGYSRDGGQVPGSPLSLSAKESAGISNLQRDVGTTLSGMLKGYCLRRRTAAPSESPETALDAASGPGQGGQSELFEELFDLIPAAHGAEQAVVHEEVTENITGYSLDLTVPGTALAIEVDGPSHYARASRIALGSTEMKRRQLKAVGYRLCSVAFWDWPSGSSTDDKERVLRSVLSPHVQEMQLPQRTGPSAGIHASRTEGRATESVTHVDTKSDADVAAPMLQQPPEDRADARESTHETGPTAGAAPAAPPASAALLPKPYRVGSIDRTGVA